MPGMNTHKSKIASLPRSIREELNRRLDDGKPSPTDLTNHFKRDQIGLIRTKSGHFYPPGGPPPPP